jgi:hypothetical protein
MHLILLLAGLLAAGKYDDIPRLHWADPDHSPITYQEYMNRVGPIQSYTTSEIRRSKSPASRRLLIITNTTLAPDIQTGLDSFIQQLAQENYQVWSITASGGTPADLRNTIVDYYNDDQIDGVFLIGDLPVAWYHIDNDFGTEGPVDFPCELIYTALNADFIDANLDGIYEDYTGDIRPVIYLGRLVPSAVNGGLSVTQAEIVNTYLEKDIDFRTGGRPLEDKALSYIDDDWSAWGSEWSSYVAQAYIDTTAVYDPYTTWSTDYVDRWDDLYEHILVCVHSSPTLHQFHRPGGLIANVPFNTVVSQQPHVHFYNLFACSNCNFVELNCMGCYYIFHGGQNGLVSIGSTKTGSMLDFNYFYEPLASGDTWAESLRQWFYDIGTTDPSWFYGMTCLGDPTLVKSSCVGADDIELAAQPTARGVLISWWGEDMVDYNLYRVDGETNIARLHRTDLSRLNRLPISGAGKLSFSDGTVRPGKVYTWLLSRITADGQENLVGNVVLGVPQLPATLALAAPRPNPAVSDVTFVINISVGSAARLEVHDLAGRLVRRWELAYPAGGESSVGWDLHDASGNPVANGVYTVSLSDGSRSVHQRLVVGR